MIRDTEFQITDPDGDTISVGHNDSFGHRSVTIYIDGLTPLECGGVRLTVAEARKFIEAVEAAIVAE